MAYSLTYGTYTFPRGFYPAEEPITRMIGAVKVPRLDGARVLTGYLDKKKFVIRGGIIKGIFDSSAVRARLDTLRSALPAGPANLTFDDDRYWRNVQVENFGLSYEGTGYNRIAIVQLDLVTGDPFQYTTAGSTDTWTVSATGQTRNITPGGNAYARPVLSITVGGSGSQTIAWTITNNTTGESFTLAGVVNGGDVIVVDCLNQSVTILGVDKTALFDGQWPRLIQGVNTLQEVYAGPAITQIVTTWNSRWF